jgi:hypothetical protein
MATPGVTWGLLKILQQESKSSAPRKTSYARYLTQVIETIGAVAHPNARGLQPISSYLQNISSTQNIVITIDVPRVCRSCSAPDYSGGAADKNHINQRLHARTIIHTIFEIRVHRACCSPDYSGATSDALQIKPSAPYITSRSRYLCYESI